MIVDIMNAEVNSHTDQASQENDIHEQMERLKAAEDKYSRKVVAHAESTRVVEGLKKDLNDVLTPVREKTMQAETAQANFASSETSWKQQKEALYKEISDLNSRCKDLVAQNSLLHQHLESVNA